MIKDKKQWAVGAAKLSAFMKFTHPPFEEDQVTEFHNIVSLLEEASGEDLSQFRIPPEKLQPEVIGAQLTTDFSSRPGRLLYSDKKRCNSSYFQTQMAGLASYLPTILEGRKANESAKYEELHDWQLQNLLVNRKLKPKRIVDQTGERFVFERAHAISELLKDDRQEPSPAVSTVYNIHGSNFIQSSPGASISQNIGVKAEELLKILEELKRTANSTELSADDQGQMQVNISTIEAQNRSLQPNPSIIKACLKSALSILENAAGGVAAGTILIAIKHYLGLP
jgi:hypothetical protein